MGRLFSWQAKGHSWQGGSCLRSRMSPLASLATGQDFFLLKTTNESCLDVGKHTCGKSNSSREIRQLSFSRRSRHQNHLHVNYFATWGMIRMIARRTDADVVVPAVDSTQNIPYYTWQHILPAAYQRPRTQDWGEARWKEQRLPDSTAWGWQGNTYGLTHCSANKTAWGDQCKKASLNALPSVTVEVTVNLSLLCVLMNTKAADLSTNTLCTQCLLYFYLSVCEALTNNWKCII